MNDTDRVSDAFTALMDLALALGHREISKLPGLCTFEVDEHWKVSINGHKEEIDHIPAYHVMPFWNGFPAGIFGPSGGIIAAGELANEDTFIEACQKRLQKIKESA